MGRKPNTTATPRIKAARRYDTPQSLNAAIKGACDILRRSNCAGAMQYVPELTWLLFLRILDEREETEEAEAAVIGTEFYATISAPFRWRDWAATGGTKRVEVEDSGQDFKKFVNEELLPHLRGLGERPDATSRQKVLHEVLTSVERTRIDNETNLRDLLDILHPIQQKSIADTHVFPLSQIYESLLLKMGEKGNDGGQFFTPREVIRIVVEVLAPEIGETIYDPCCGTGGFLAQAAEYFVKKYSASRTTEQSRILSEETFYGCEKDDTVYPMAIANLVLHGIDRPHLWHGNTLTKERSAGSIFEDPFQFHDIVLSNPPFGGKESKETQKLFDFQTGATQVLFLQHILDSLKDGGRCGIVLDEGVLFRANEEGFVKTKKRLMDECELYCIVSLPGGVFSSAGAGVKTDLLFFRKGRATEKIWYYDLSGVKVGKTTPMTHEHFDGFFEALPERKETERSWSIDIKARKAEARAKYEPLREDAEKKRRESAHLKAERKAVRRTVDSSSPKLQAIDTKIESLERESRELLTKAQAIEWGVYDLKAVNPNAPEKPRPATPSELLQRIASRETEIADALTSLRSLISE